MAVTLQISGFNMTGNAIKQATIPDGWTISIDRLPDGTSFIHVVPPKEQPEVMNGVKADISKISDLNTREIPAFEGLYPKGYFGRYAVCKRLNSFGDLASAVADQIAALHDEFRNAQAAAEDRGKRVQAEILQKATAASDTAARQVVREVLAGGVRIGIGPRSDQPGGRLD